MYRLIINKKNFELIKRLLKLKVLYVSKTIKFKTTTLIWKHFFLIKTFQNFRINGLTKLKEIGNYRNVSLSVLPYSSFFLSPTQAELYAFFCIIVLEKKTWLVYIFDFSLSGGESLLIREAHFPHLGCGNEPWKTSVPLYIE